MQGKGEINTPDATFKAFPKLPAHRISKQKLSFFPKFSKGF